MPRDRTDIRAIKERIDVISVISRYVSLTQAGASHKGRCPFHKDDTPSFVVSGEKGLWHCFGCGEGGDIVGFLMKIEKISFIEAAKRLADEAGVEFQTSEEDGDREKLRAVMAEAAGHFVDNLRNESTGQRARAYFLDRGYGEDAWERYGLGYALPGWENIKRAFSQRYSEGRLLELGLLVQGERGTYDRFRDRTIFPVLDLSGRPIAFGGRAFEGEPKYLNSPKTPLFDKGRTLYGLSWAREAFAEDRQAVLVEGYTDVLSLHCAGLKNVVASMGTALTQGQADLLSRFVDEVVIVYDRDAAGGAAALRGMQILGNSGLAVRVARLADGEDPDSVVRRDGPDAMRDALRQAVPFYRFYVEELRSRSDSTSIAGKERILGEAREFSRGIRSLPIRQALSTELSGLLDLPSEGILREISRRRWMRAPESAIGTSTERRTPEEDLLVLLLRGEIEWQSVSDVLTPDAFSPTNRPIAQALAESQEKPNISELVERLDDESGRRVSQYALASVRFDDVNRATEDALLKLVQLPSFAKRLSELDTEIAACEENGDRERQNDLTLKRVELLKEKLARKGMHGQED
ncbi:MAG: DNA primase [Candidatus Bipolaricaulia bacterium]